MEIDHTDGSGVPDRIASSRLNPQSRHFTLIAQTATLDRHGFRLHIFAPQSGAPYLVVSRHRLPEIEGLFA